MSYRLPDTVATGLPIVYIGKVMGMGKRSQRDRSEFGQRMLEARNRAGLTQKAVQAALDVAQGTLSDLEGAAKGSSKTAQFAALYGCDPIWLATGAGDPKWQEDAPTERVNFSKRTATESDWTLLDAVRHELSEEQIQEIKAKYAAFTEMVDREVMRRLRSGAAPATDDKGKKR